jgi:hypothetical protein
MLLSSVGLHISFRAFTIAVRAPVACPTGNVAASQAVLAHIAHGLSFATLEGRSGGGVRNGR